MMLLGTVEGIENTGHQADGHRLYAIKVVMPEGSAMMIEMDQPVVLMNIEEDDDDER